MHELPAILGAWRAAAGPDRPGVLATVVQVQGSAYRRPGARMLMLHDGNRIGSVSGGCLEGDLAMKAWWLTERRQPTVRVYDTSSDEDAVWEFGLGCNGVIQVLLERLDHPATQETLMFLERCQRSRAGAAVVTIIRAGETGTTKVGDRLLVDADGVAGGALRNTSLEAELRPHAEVALREERSRLIRLAECDVFVEWVGPPLSLVLFGAGHDAVPVVALAKQLGWHVTVADGRPAYARPERLPGADRVVVVPHHDPLQGVAVGSDCAVVLMTHNYAQDGRLLERLVSLRPRYLGMLGPRDRAERLLASLPPGNGEVDLHAPVGLDIGSETPEIIALAMVAEIQAVLSGRPGGMLRHRAGTIHLRTMDAPDAAQTSSGIPRPMAQVSA